MPFNLGPRTGLAVAYALVAASSYVFHSGYLDSSSSKPKAHGPIHHSLKEYQDNAIQPKVVADTSNSLSLTDLTANIVANDDQLDKVLDTIIDKWNLTAQAKPYLERIWHKDNSYNASGDLVVFHHPMKTGGSSVSDVLDKLGKAVPGSARSSIFHFDVWKTKFQQHNQWARQQQGNPKKGEKPLKEMTPPEWFDKFRVLYSHSYYRNYPHSNQPQTTGLYKVLKANAPQKRARHITMVREPFAFTASNFNEWFCRLHKWQQKAQTQGLPTNHSNTAAQCYGYSLRDLATARRADNERRCLHKTEQQLKAMAVPLRRECQKIIKTGNLDATPECASIERFLQSRQYQQHFHNHATYSRCTLEESNDHSIADYSHGALEYLGGIDTPDGYGDMMWFGVTERMKESMCWLHYELKLPTIETPRSRVQSCRPTKYWTEDNRLQFYRQEPIMVAVHRAANAVLDLQVAKLQHQVGLVVQQESSGDVAAMLESMPWITPKCLDAKLWKSSSVKR